MDYPTVQCVKSHRNTRHHQQPRVSALASHLITYFEVSYISYLEVLRYLLTADEINPLLQAFKQHHRRHFRLTVVKILSS
jgi:hypothetical protein